ncbi:Carboxylesterase NlhH [Aquisphaera giovannonii]|uniref:Carboxylesterase NlhH n=1 Tax=Aquisphaera giovannonii TaxID=406548 RepID=A0A5B9VYS4_9BACT|nr:alpha/beta hydrolase [Aquisphaera giovannonii]QEH33493.1 Carboxylesterase NlhH [Aquisphaera giovannonii]
MGRRRSLVLGAAVVVVGLAAALQGRQEEPPASVDFRPDVPYATAAGEGLRLDFARPKGGQGPYPLVVCIHGGGWSGGDKAEFRQALFALAQQGLAVASLQYRLAPRHPFPAQYDDVKAAVSFLRAKAKEWSIDPGRVAAFGGSAGGHLALLLATDPDVNLKAVVSMAGPTRLNTPLPDLSARLVRQLIGTPGTVSASYWRTVNPIDRVGPHVAPILLIHGDRDEIVPYEQSVSMFEACKVAGVEVELLTIPGGGHGSGGRREDNEAAIIKAVSFLKDHLGVPPGAAAR